MGVVIGRLVECLWVRCERRLGLGRWTVWELGEFLLVVVSRVGSRAGYRGFSELQGRGEGEWSRERGKLDRGSDRTRVGLPRGQVSVSFGVLGREISANPHFFFGSWCGSSDWAVGRVSCVRCERRPGLVRWEVWELGASLLVVVSLG